MTQLRRICLGTFWGILLSLTGNLSALGQNSVYFEHLRNEKLADQIQKGPFRFVPQGETYSLAFDTYLYKPWGEEAEYYHGNGYWVNAYAELRPNRDLALNTKLIAYNGASSYGYGSADFIQPMFGVTWEPSFVEPVQFGFRFFDLDRQTFGAGLMIDEKEMNGLQISLEYESFRYLGLVDGTGAYYRLGDTYYQQLDWRNNLLGLSFMFINYEGHSVTLTNRRDGTSQVVGPYGIPTWTLFSRANWTESIRTDVEAGYRNQASAALFRLGWRPKFQSSWKVDLGVQGRYYGKGFANQYTGSVQQDYVSPEIKDKSFTEPRTLFAIGDNVVAGALRLDLETKPVWWMRLLASNEIYHYAYRDIGTWNGYFFKHGFSVCPYREYENDCLLFFASNKSLTARGPLRSEELPEMPFENIFHAGVEAFIYL